jgi:hypothetical protein
MLISRRAVLIGTSAMIPAGCGIITTTTTGGVTKISINVAEVDAWAQAFVNAGNLIYGLPGVAGLLGPIGSVVQIVVKMVAADVMAFDKSAGGVTDLTFDATSIPAALNSILADGRKLLATVQGALPQIGAINNVSTYANALATIVSVVEAALGVSPVSMRAGAVSPTAEAAALAVLGVK